MNSMSFPEELYYSKSHEWFLVEENLITMGLTEVALLKLGEILYLDLPEEGQNVSPAQIIGTIESIRQIHDLSSLIGGSVLEVNSAVLEDPGIVHDDPMGEGWLFRMELDNERDLALLLRAAEYKAHIKSLV